MPEIQPIIIEPVYLEKVWGGQRLKHGDAPIGEAWLLYEDNRVLSAPWEGRTLGELSAKLGEWLLGKAAIEQTGNRFPLLIKLLDTRQWLSVQVHPNDEQARQMEGAGEFGKTEAWHILETDPGAELIFGLIPGTTRQAFTDAIRDNRVMETLQTVETTAGETYFIPAGTIHALGPGLLLYEVQQTSDTTYRVYDWDRPARDGRNLHIEQAIAVTNPNAAAIQKPADNRERVRAQCPYFVLEQLRLDTRPTELDTGTISFHALTCTSGSAMVKLSGGSRTFEQYQSILIPAAAGQYELRADTSATVLLARVP